MPKKKLSTLVVFVQDETGSMYEIQEQTISAFNEYFDTLKKEKGLGDVRVQAWQFSDTLGEEPLVRPLHDGTLKKVPKLNAKNYRPRGQTPLLDAVGTAIQQAEEEKVDRYLFIVQTDGYENASKDFKREQVAKLLEEKEKSDNWTLVFLGTGVNNWSKEVGAAQYNTTSFPLSQTRSVYASTSAVSADFLSSTNLKDKSFTKKVEKKVKETS